jgi:hypothetical protein
MGAGRGSPANPTQETGLVRFAISEDWIKSKGALKLCVGDYETCYALNKHFFFVDQTSQKVFNIVPFRDNKHYFALYQYLTNPHHLACRQQLIRFIDSNGLYGWFCNQCAKEVSLN